MSLSGSSASRKSIWAITRFARSSSMKVGRKMIRSFNRREKMANARSPRGVCSITIGTRAIGFSLSQARLGRGALRLALPRLRPDLSVTDEQLEGQAVTQPTPQLLEVAALLHHTPDGRQRPLARLGDLLQLGDLEELRRGRSEEHTSELQSPCNLVCRLLLEKKKNTKNMCELMNG